MQKKGCDASNFYDEEMDVKDQEFSDDEKEREFKKAKKQKNKGNEKDELLGEGKKRK